MKILVDTSIVIGSNFLVSNAREQKLKWGSETTCVTVAGFKRTALADAADQQREKDALFTIGRLARAGRISVHSYNELILENWRGGPGKEPLVNALGGCKFLQCSAALERSKFQQTVIIDEWIAKGGGKDKKNGVPASDFNQIPFFERLASLSSEEVSTLLDHARNFGLDDFEVGSLQDLPWFQKLAHLLCSPEHLPDCFHIWTTRRNGLDVFLTLEKKLPRIIEQIKNRRKKVIDMNVAVIRPTGLLNLLGITEIDEVPITSGRFYSYSEIFEINRRLLKNQESRPA